MKKNNCIVKSLTNVIKVKRNDLTLHPVLKSVYTYEDESAIIELGNSMKEVGQLQPIIINSKNQIISGGRRWKATFQADIEILDAIIRDSENSNEAISIVCHNQHRTKSIPEIIAEAEILLGLLGKQQGKRNDLLKELDGFIGLKGDRYEKAANIIGNISSSSLRKLINIVDFEKLSVENKKFGLIDTIVIKGLSIDKASKMMETFNYI